MSNRWRAVLRWTFVIAGVALLYYGSARMLVALSAPPSGAVLAVWISSGISVAAMIVFGPFAVVGAFLGSLAFELLAGTPPLGSAGMATVNVIGELTTYFLIVGFRRRAKRRFALDTIRGVTRFLVAAAAGAVISSTLGTGVYVLAGVLEPADYWSSWLTFFGSVVIGIVLVTPILVYTIRDRGWLGQRARIAQFVVLLAAISVLAWLWRGSLLPEGARESTLFLGIGLLIVFALLFEAQKVSFAVVGFGVGAIWGSVEAVTRQSYLPPYADLFALQLVICGVAMIGFLVSAIVTEQKESEVDLRLGAKMFEGIDEGVVVTLLDGTIVDVNDGLTRMFGFTSEELIGVKPGILKSGWHDAAFYRDMWGSLHETGQWKGEVWDRRADGSILPALLSITATPDDQGRTTHYVGVYSDIREIKAVEDRLVRLATHDSLTCLANRDLLIEELALAISRARRTGTRLAISLVDIDYFKTINAARGHAQGDQLLIQFARRLSSLADEGDIVGRAGADEFIIIASDIKEVRQLEGIANRLIENMRQPFQVGNSQIDVSVSAGVVVFPSDGEDVDTLLRHADVALYWAKEAGGDRSQLFSGELQEEFERLMKTEGELRRAIETGELFVLYQPQVDLLTGRIEAIEALVRWRTADGTVRMPGDFIPVAEESGLIMPLGEQVLRRACEDVAGLRAEGFDLKVAVNFSPRQFREADVPELLRVALAESGLPAEALDVEITETTLMSSSKDMVSTIAAIRDLGVRISLDDFGAEYSSLKYVRLFSPDRLKIDRFFTQGLPADPASRVVVLATLAMVQGLRTDVVAEGVETVEQLQFLRANGFLHAQGFLFSKPVPLAEVRRLLEAGAYDLSGFGK